MPSRGGRRGRYVGGRFLAAAAVLSLVGSVLALGWTGSTPEAATAPGPAAAAALDRLPLAFEANTGAFDPEIRFTARAPGQHVALTADGMLVSPAGVKLTLEGARPDAHIVGGDPLGATVSRFFGGDPSAWQRGIPTYGSVRYRDVYPGVDLVFHGHGRDVEHDFVVGPGADPAAIGFSLAGTGTVPRLDPGGDLVVGDVRLRAPVLYQEAGGTREPVEGAFVERGPGRYGFWVGPYDRSLPLVIDPVLISSSYVGGTSTDTAYAVALDQDGNVVVTGYTESGDFPTLNPAQPSVPEAEGPRTDVFVTKVKADGTTVLWSTYLGGRGRDAAYGVAVGSDGAVYVTGYTESADFPAVRAFQAAHGGGSSDVFVARINSAGSAIDWSTFVGGSGTENASGIAVDAQGAVIVGGSTESSNFPVNRPFQGVISRPDDTEGFLVKISPGGNGLAWSSYLGGAGSDHISDVAVDAQGDVYLAGDTQSGNFPTVRPLQEGLGGATSGTGSTLSDGFVGKVKGDGSGILYSTYLGGSDSDKATGIAVDAAGAAYVVGNTGSVNFPVASAFQAEKDGDFDAFVSKLRPDGSTLAYSTYLGGSGSDGAQGIAVDRRGHAHVTGATASADFPTNRPFQSAKGGGFVDAFVTNVGASGSSLTSSSYLGARDDDQAAGIAIDGDGNPVVVGYTNSGDFPIVKAFQPAKGGGVGDAFIAKIREDGEGEAAASNPAASRRERRVRTLITITGGLFLAAVLQSVWLRRRPEPKPKPADVGVGAGAAAGKVELPGVTYVPRRGPAPPVPPPGPTASMRTWADEPPPGELDDRRVEEDEAPVPAGDSDPWAPSPPERDVAEVTGVEDRPEREPEPARMAAPDLWGPEDRPVAAPPAPAGTRPTDEWSAAGASDELDPLDVWGPLAAAHDPSEWADEWGIEDLVRPEEPPPAATPPPAAASRPEPLATTPPPAQPALSLSDLLSEDLPIPEPAGKEETNRGQVWLSDILDEEFPIPEVPEVVAAHVQPEPEAPGAEEEFLPPPPPRLLENLFEPDSDDPLVQSTRSGKNEPEED